MASNPATGRAREIIALVCVIGLLCTGTVRGAPVGAVTFTTFDPMTDSKTSVPCGEKSEQLSTPDVRKTETDNADVQILIAMIDHFSAFYHAVFRDYTMARLGEMAVEDVINLKVPNLPDIEAVHVENMTDEDLITTHFYIVKGFKAAMLAVINDENENNNSNGFTDRFKDIERDLGGILQGTQDVICARGIRGTSAVGEPVDLDFAGANAMMRLLRDYNVLYHMKEYVTKLYQDTRRLMDWS